MRISHKHKLIGISIPKSGCEAIFKIMEKDFGAKQHGSFHGVRVPENCKDYKAFTFVRDPYERAIALYNMLAFPGDGSDIMRMINHEYYKQEVEDLEFETFCSWLGNCPKESMVYEASTSQYEHLRNCNITNIEYIKLDENPLNALNMFLVDSGLFAVYDFPKQDITDYSEYLNSWECFDLVTEWAKEDFEEYGYALNDNRN